MKTRYLVLVLPDCSSNLIYFMFSLSVSWTLAGVAALPFAFLTSIYYVDYSAEPPYIWNESSTCPKIVESSTCSLVDTNVRIHVYQCHLNVNSILIY